MRIMAFNHLATVVARNENETEQLGFALARALQPGCFVGLVGTLGAGKTRLVQAIAQAMGVNLSDVGSPTFSLSRIYQAENRTLNHIDLFRINDEDEYFELGIDECLDQGQIVLVEWADKFPKCLPPDRIEIEIVVSGVSERSFQIKSIGEIDPAILSEFSE